MKQKQDKLQAIYFQMIKLLVMEYLSCYKDINTGDKFQENYLYQTTHSLLLEQGTYYANRYVAFIQQHLYDYSNITFRTDDIEQMLDTLIKKREDRYYLRQRILESTNKKRMDEFYNNDKANKIAERIYKKHGSPKFRKQKITSIIFGYSIYIISQKMV